MSSYNVVLGRSCAATIPVTMFLSNPRGCRVQVPSKPCSGWSPWANCPGDWCSDWLFEVLPFIPSEGTTLALLTSLRAVPVGRRYRRPCVGLAFRSKLIASDYLHFGRTRWDFTGDVRGPCIRRDCVYRPDKLHALNRDYGGRDSPYGESRLRPVPGSSSSVLA